MKVQSIISEVLRYELPQLLEPLFDELAPENQIVRIDSLQVDTGILPASNIKQYFTEQLLVEIKKAILAKKDNADTENETVVIRKEKSLGEGLFHFLKFGVKPWFVASQKKDEWEREMQQQFTRSDWQKVSSWLQQNHKQQPVILQRLVRQFSNDFLNELILQLFSFNRDEWRTVYGNLLALFRYVEPGKEPEIKSKLWLNCITSFLTWQHQDKALYAVLKAPFHASPEKAYAFFTQKKEDIEIILNAPVFHHLVEQLRDEITKHNTEELTNDGDKISKISNDKRDTASHRSIEENKNAFPIENNESSFEQENTREKLLKNFSDISQKEQREKNKSVMDAVWKEAQYVSNCGVVLLHPFLEMYFDELGLLYNKEFIIEEVCKRAVLLLHFLATGETGIAEFDLLLQKILCGLSLEEALPGEIEVSDKEKEESEKLLQSVINYWPPLKHTSIEGLRSTFLQREGRLEKKENGWLLTIEQKTIDLLLDKLPWGFSTIKLPWMNEMISVDWC